MLPRFCRVRQSFDDRHIGDISGAVINQLASLELDQVIGEGDSVAVTAGSRGIADIATITRATVGFLQQIGAKPFVVPAMGSHGGGTAGGQVKVLASLGMTPESLGCEIRSSMETVTVCEHPLGFPVHFDRHAWEADHVVVINRIKAHTGISGPLESGLIKMLLVGLGKHEGAKLYHRAMEDHSFQEIAEMSVDQVIRKCRIACGLGIVENAFEKTAVIRGLAPHDFLTGEPKLLELAKSLMPRLPMDDLDMLLVDQMGKNISGTGMDTNIVGRKFNDNAAMPGETPRIKRICVRDLTEATGGNATGIGIAEFCRSQLVEKIDHRITAINCITALHPTGAMIPIHFPTDREMLEAAGSTLGLVPLDKCQMAWIQNTLHLNEFECSEPAAEMLANHSGLEFIGDPRQIPFDGLGNLPWFPNLWS